VAVDGRSGSARSREEQVYELSNLGIPWCGVTPPDNQLGDTQLAGEYDVYAIRYLYHQSGERKVAIVGHSQSGMQPRWPLRIAVGYQHARWVLGVIDVLALPMTFALIRAAPRPARHVSDSSRGRRCDELARDHRTIGRPKE
jgi:hypothetical protein